MFLLTHVSESKYDGTEVISIAVSSTKLKLELYAETIKNNRAKFDNLLRLKSDKLYKLHQSSNNHRLDSDLRRKAYDKEMYTFLLKIKKRYHFYDCRPGSLGEEFSIEEITVL